MPEHTIPESLLANIRSGKATLVVGAGFGIPTWKQLLERMNKALIDRGDSGDEAAAKDVEKLLHKGSLVRAAGFLGRTLGESACDQIVKEMWGDLEISEVAKALAVLPFRTVWTTFPGDVLERAFAEYSPQGWPAPRVVTYQNAGEIDRRRRCLLKILGDLESFVVTPRSIRKALAGAQGLREHVRSFYSEGSLVFVGFRYGDPDLAGLLDRVFGQFEPPQSEHFLVASGVGPVTVDEMAAEHDLQIINLPGKGTDDKATEALLGFLQELKAACEEEQVSLLNSRPHDDDLEGWLSVLHEDPFDQEAAKALTTIEEQAQQSGDWERVVEVLMARVETEGAAPTRATYLRSVANIYEKELGDLPRAFTAVTAALTEDPSDLSLVETAERLARATGNWAELVADVAQVAGDTEDKDAAAELWTKLGVWYHKELDHIDYAIAAFREAEKLAPTSLEPRRKLVELYRNKQRWADMAEELSTLSEGETVIAAKVENYLSLGELYETQLAQVSKAMEAYQHAADVDPTSDDALAALERLYRKHERWGKLASVLERRAEWFETAGDITSASATRRELATLRAERLGDLEGAIVKYEAALKINDADAATLRALEELYDKVGRTADYIKTLERLSEVAPAGERGALLRRLAIESQERGQPEAALSAYQRLIELDPNSSSAEDAYRAMARVCRDNEWWERLVNVLEKHAAKIKTPAARADAFEQMAETYEQKLNDPHRAIDAALRAHSEQEGRKTAMAALGRLYARTEQWPLAVKILVDQAKLGSPTAYEQWTQAGEIAFEEMHQPEVAVGHFERALALEPSHAKALLPLAKIAKQLGNWANSIKYLREAAQHQTNRQEQIQTYLEIARISADKLSDKSSAEKAWLRVLELDPENRDAGEAVCDALVAEHRWQEALPVCEMLARTAGENPAERARYQVELGKICRALRYVQKAAAHFRAALEVDPESLEAASGLAEALFWVAKDQRGEGTEVETKWREIEERHRNLLARHRSSLADEKAAELWHRLGVSLRALNELGKAEHALRCALEKDPAHSGALDELADLANLKSDWKTVVEIRREQLKSATDDNKVRILEQIGDVCLGKMKDPDAALGAYLQAISLRPNAFSLLHKVLDVYSERKDWRHAIDTLSAIADTENDLRRRAKYHYTAAVVARDELKDASKAVHHFARSLEDDPTIPKAFDALEQLLRETGDHKTLAREYRKMLKRMGEEAPPEQLLRLWTGLGELASGTLHDVESAIVAYEAATSISPETLSYHEQLANLYLEAGDSRRLEAIQELQTLLAAEPERVELYRALSRLYREEGETDKAYCLAQTLIFLQAANREERELFEKMRPQRFTLAKRRITEELWQKSILHITEDRHINAIFSSLSWGIAASQASPPEAYSLEQKKRVDLGSSDRPAARMFRYSAHLLGIDPEPSLFWCDDSGVKVANTAQQGRIIPSFLLGPSHQSSDREMELAFDLSKRLTYLRPERYVNFALPTLPKIEAAFYAAQVASGHRPASDTSKEAQDMARELTSSVPEPILSQVGLVVSKMNIGPKNGVIPRWRVATDLTANRVGLIVCNDLETAARMVATESSTFSTLPVKERLRDLIAYSASEGYFAVRKHIGIAVGQV